MNLESYLSNTESKYAIISAEAYTAEPLAQSISSEPARFTIGGKEYVILSLDPRSVPDLVAYIQHSGKDVEFEFVQGSGKVSLLLHGQARTLIAAVEPPAEQ